MALATPAYHTLVGSSSLLSPLAACNKMLLFLLIAVVAHDVRRVAGLCECEDTTTKAPLVKPCNGKMRDRIMLCTLIFHENNAGFPVVRSRYEEVVMLRIVSTEVLLRIFFGYARHRASTQN